MMNRRQLLKRVGAACAAAVTVPVALVRSKEEPKIIGDRKCVTMTEFVKMQEYDAWHKNAITGGRRWIIDYYNECSGPFSEKDLEVFRAALKNTKFKPPVKP